MCSSNDCRGERCCALNMETATNATCTACDVNGACSGCADGFTVVQGVCLASCWTVDGLNQSQRILHGGSDQRIM